MNILVNFHLRSIRFCYAKAIPLEPTTAPALGMEHLQSSTFLGDTTGFRLKPLSREELIKTNSHLSASYGTCLFCRYVMVMLTSRM